MSKLKRAVGLAGALAGVPCFGAAPKPPAGPPQVYAVLLTPGPHWVKGKSVLEQDLGAHVAYMIKLQKKDTLVLGGPYLDNTGGEYVLDVKTEKEARAIVAADPAVKSGLFVPHIHAWLTPFRRK